MTSDEALYEGRTVHLFEALHELHDHQMVEGIDFEIADRCNQQVIADVVTGETIASIDSDGQVNTRDILIWLGY